MSIRDYITDRNMETGGVWIDFRDFRIRVARAGRMNERFTKYLSGLQRQYGKRLNLDDEEIAARMVAETIVLDWETHRMKGIENLDGNGLLPVTPENIYETLKQAPDLCREILDFSTDREAFLAETREEDSGNF